MVQFYPVVDGFVDLFCIFEQAALFDLLVPEELLEQLMILQLQKAIKGGYLGMVLLLTGKIVEQFLIKEDLPLEMRRQSRVLILHKIHHLLQVELILRVLEYLLDEEVKNTVGLVELLDLDYFLLGEGDKIVHGVLVALEPDRLGELLNVVLVVDSADFLDVKVLRPLLGLYAGPETHVEGHVLHRQLQTIIRQYLRDDLEEVDEPILSMDDQCLQQLRVHNPQRKPKLPEEDPQMLVNRLILKTQLADILYKVRLQLKGNSLNVLLDINHKNPSILLLTLLVDHCCVLHAGWVLEVGVLEVDELAEQEMRD